VTNHFDTTRRILAVLIGLSIPISTALTNILCPLAILLLLAEGQYKQKFNTLRQHPVALFAILLFTFLLIGLLYTPVPLSEAGRIVDKYREWLYIPFFILIFRDQQSREWGLYAFLAAMGITLFLAYLMAISGWQVGKGTPENPFIFKNYITQNLLMALATYFVAIQAWQKPQWRWLLSIVVLLAVYNILFMSAGRTGYLILFCLIVLLFYQAYRIRGILLASLVLILLSVIAYTSSDILRQRIDKIPKDMAAYQQGDSHSSIGYRFEFYKNTLYLIAQHPIIGHGTGSFTHEYQQLAEKHGLQPTANPHSEYLMIGVQLGLIGIGLFIALLYLMWYSTRYLKKEPALLAQGLVVTIAVGCLINSLWLDTTEGHIFAYLIGVFYGGLQVQERLNIRRD
jgi:O-antigen ligase